MDRAPKAASPLGSRFGGQPAWTTEAAACKFTSAAWGTVAPRITRLLESRGADRHTAEDLTQETWARVWQAGVTFGSCDDLFRYSATVARRLLIGVYRKSRRVAGSELPDDADDSDIDRQVQYRLALDAAWRTIATMDPLDRDAILHELNGRPPWDEREYRMWKMRRSRARERLRRLMEGVAAFVLVRRRSQPATWHFEVVAAASWLMPVVTAVLSVAASSPPTDIAGETQLVAAPYASAEPRPPQSPAPGTTVSSPQSTRPVGGDRTREPAQVPLISTPDVDRQVPSAAVAPYDGSELRVCTKDDPVVGTGCPLVVTVPRVLP